MFKVLKESFGKFARVKLINTKSNEYASIIPGFGGNINEITLAKGGRIFPILDGAKDYSELIENKGFRGAKLFPFPNRINRGEYTFQNKAYKLPINDSSKKHAIHGLLYNKQFRIIGAKMSETQAMFIIEYTGGGFEGYPFKFSVAIEYLLSDDGFKCTTTAVNRDKTDIPIGDGWHPYFTLGCKVDDLFLKLSSNLRVSLDKNRIPTGERALENPFFVPKRIGKQKVDAGFIITEKAAITEISNTITDVTIQVWQEAGQGKYNYLQVFIPPDRKSIAIEPMSCMADAFNNREGLILLKPKEKFSASFGVRLK